MDRFPRFCFLYLCIISSVASQGNIVPNPGFEDYLDIPDIWYYNGEHFTEIVKYWSSPTPASPDAYGEKIIVPRHWKEKGFGQIRPHLGTNMIGLTIYGCEKGKPHCREYVQIRLAEPMVSGQEYEISFWVAHLKGSLFANNLGITFSRDELYHDVDEKLNATPQIVLNEIMIPPLNGWENYARKYRANESYEFMTIGNFITDTETKTNIKSPSGFGFAYYYLDDISVKKIKPILQVPQEEDPLADLKLETGSKITLENIYFDYDRADFLARSYVQLNALFNLLKNHTDLVIEIQGHTDIMGNDEYNLNLSLERAKAVVSYLAERGISATRLQYTGYGSALPIAPNDTFEGRRKNRRVEFLILESSESNE